LYGFKVMEDGFGSQRRGADDGCATVAHTKQGDWELWLLQRRGAQRGCGLPVAGHAGGIWCRAMYRGMRGGDAGELGCKRTCDCVTCGVGMLINF
jgi:hypothetical protein